MTPQTDALQGESPPYDAQVNTIKPMIENAKKPDPRPRKKRVGSLKTVGQIISESARLYREARRGEIPASDASKLASILTGMRQAVEIVELKGEIDTLRREISGEKPPAALPIPLRRIK